MVTVIIPSYNRAKILPLTIPTYVQQYVSEIILIDDASTDNTSDIVHELQKQIPILKYIRLNKNSKQTVAKNTGIMRTHTEWIYFGDDDSVLLPDSIPTLYKTALEYKADICGTKAIYMETGGIENVTDYVKQWNIPLPKGKKIIDIQTFSANLCYSLQEPIELPFVQASALVRSQLAKEIMFDIKYTGNAYREETDFFIRCHLKGYKIIYQSKAVQINLPRKMSSGGAHTKSKITWYLSAISNNWYFLQKNWHSIKHKYPALPPKTLIQLRFEISLCLAGCNNLFHIIKNKLISYL